MTKYKTVIKPANNSPDSIEDVFSVVLVNSSLNDGRVDTRICHLEGTVEEKLQQYKDFTGEDWKGFDEQVFSTPINPEPTYLNLGKVNYERTPHPADVEVQEKIDALTALAARHLRDNKIAQQKKKLLTARARVKQLV